MWHNTIEFTALIHHISRPLQYSPCGSWSPGTGSARARLSHVGRRVSKVFSAAPLGGIVRRIACSWRPVLHLATVTNNNDTKLLVLEVILP